MDDVYHGYSADELAVQLDVEKTVPNLPEIQQRNGADSARVRGAMPCTLDVAYGPAEPQKLDIFAPATPSEGGYPVLIDIHGGGWRAGSKSSRSFPAEVLVPHGIVWVPIDYGLAPQFKMDQIVDHARSALAWVHKNIAGHGGDPERIYVAGNSAGGHLTGTLLMPDWHEDYGVPGDVIKGACAISGVFDLEALVKASRGFNDELGMTLEEAHRFSPYRTPPTKSCPIIVAFGSEETDEFRRQSEDFADRWYTLGLDVVEQEVMGANHFSIARDFIDPDSPLHQTMLSMMGFGPDGHDWRQHHSWG